MSSALILSLLAKFWPFILAAIGAAWAVFKAYTAGKASERAKQDKARQKARTIADEVDNDIGAMPADEARKRLSTWDM